MCEREEGDCEDKSGNCQETRVVPKRNARTTLRRSVLLKQYARIKVVCASRNLKIGIKNLCKFDLDGQSTSQTQVKKHRKVSYPRDRANWDLARVGTTGGTYPQVPGAKKATCKALLKGDDDKHPDKHLKAPTQKVANPQKFFGRPLLFQPSIRQSQVKTRPKVSFEQT